MLTAHKGTLNKNSATTINCYSAGRDLTLMVTLEMDANRMNVQSRSLQTLISNVQNIAY